MFETIIIMTLMSMFFVTIIVALSNIMKEILKIRAIVDLLTNENAQKIAKAVINGEFKNEKRRRNQKDA